MGKHRYMECGTIRPGRPCPFMTLDGCDFEGGCQPILVLCEGCKHVEEWPDGLYCGAYPQPLIKWRTICNTATHLKKRVEPQEKKVNPIKKSKRGTK